MHAKQKTQTAIFHHERHAQFMICACTRDAQEASSSALFVVNITMHVVIHYLFIVFQLQLLNIIEDTSTSTTIPIRTIQWFIFPLIIQQFFNDVIHKTNWKMCTHCSFHFRVL
eukprot:1080212_1